MQKIGIIGWSQTDFSERRDDVSRNDLIYEASRKALEHAGLGIDQVDSVISASCDTIDGISISNAFAADEMGAYMKEESKVEEDGAYALMYAYYRLLTGFWKTALVVSHGKISDSGAPFYANMMCDPFVLRPLGLEVHSSAALQCRAYAERYGVEEKDIAAVAVKNRRNGAMNETTQLRSAVSLDEVLGSPLIASPIHKLEAPPVTDGATAVVLAVEDFAGTAGKRAAWIEGIGFAQDQYYPGYKDLSGSKSAELAGQMAYREAGVNDPRKELNMAEISEGYAFYELLLCEALGLCAPGEAKKMLADGVTDRDGAFPVNVSGGGLCANPMMSAGLLRVIECCKQLTGEAGKHQLNSKPRRALAHASSGLFLQSNLAIVLGGE